MTACNTPVKEGIKVVTQSERLTAIRRKVMELMLVNHPLDCPVCDAGGECDLQDACYGLDVVKQEYSALLEKRAIRYDWPLIESDPNRCILCEKCVKVDHEIVGCDAITLVNRGEATIVDTLDGKPLNCEFCGNCIAACPTGTLISKPFKFAGRPWALNVTKSICAFCGNGCQIEYHSKEGQVVRVTSEDSTFNSGNLCINGRFGYSYLNSADRLTAPLMTSGKVQLEADWDEAMSFAAEKLRDIIKKCGANAVAGIASPRVTNEENFLFQKFMRTAVGTNNIDSEARFGYAVAQTVLRNKLGLTGASSTIDRIDNAGAVLVIGADLNAEATATEYRVIKAAFKNDAKLVVANMRQVKLRKFANSMLQYKPGGELALINGLMKAIIDGGLEDKNYASGKVANFEALKSAIASQSMSDLAAASGVNEERLYEAASLIANEKSVAIIFGADLMRGKNASESITALADLALLTGCVGKESGGLFPIDTKNNMQGLLDAGAAPDHLPGYQPAADKGKDFWQIIEGIEKEEIKALYVLGSDLASYPDNNRIKKALAKLELLIVQDIFATETARMAHVVFPAAAAAEKTGSFTTTDNRLQLLGKAVNPIGKARADCGIIGEFYNRLTNSNEAQLPAALLDEFKAVSSKAFNMKTDLAFSPAVPAIPAATSQLNLLVGPIGYHNGTTTTHSKNNLSVSSEGYIEIFAADAAKLGVSEGTMLKVSSPAGVITGKAKVSDKLQTGLLFAPSHFRDLNANSLLQGSINLVSVTVEKA